VIAVDTGFLLALLDRRDAWHARAAAFASSAEEGWITTWPVLTESTHMLQRTIGSRFVQGLLQEVANGAITTWDIPEARLQQIPQMMQRYANLPMDLADASLVLLAEHLGHGRILTTDERDFGTYRWKSHKPFHSLLAGN